MSDYSELKELLGKCPTRPWFVHPPLRHNKLDPFLAYGDPNDDSENYDVIEYEEHALELIVAAVNALPELLAELDKWKAGMSKAHDDIMHDGEVIDELQAKLDAAQAALADATAKGYVENA